MDERAVGKALERFGGRLREVGRKYPRGWLAKFGT